MISKHSQGLINLLKLSEGCRLEAYKDTNGIPTIGYGATHYENGLPVKMYDSITQQAAEDLLNHLLTEYDNAVASYVPAIINQNQFDALVDFAYNCGKQNLKGSTLLKKVIANPADTEIAFEFNKWVHGANGQLLPGLVTRRKNEVELYFTPVN